MSAGVIDFQTQVLDRSQEVPVVVDFWAEWCGPCRILGPVIEELAGEAEGQWELVKVDTEANQALSQQYGIQSIPSVMMFSKGEKIADFQGALPKYQIERWLTQHLPDPNFEAFKGLVQQWRAEPTPEHQLALEEFSAQHPDLLEARLALAQINISQDPEKALEYLTPIHEGHPLYPKVADLKSLAELTTFSPSEEGHPKAVPALTEAVAAWRQRQVEVALDHLIRSIMLDKSIQKELARRATVAIFHQLGEQHPITKQFRPRFSMALY
ncbi:MAG: thioredoxin [Bacteroidota bacterium]